MPDLLRYLHAVLLPFALYAYDHRRPWLLWSASTANDSPTICGQLRCHHPRLMVGRPLQRSCLALRYLRHNRCTGVPRLRRLASTCIRFSLRLSDRRRKRIVQLHPASARMAEQQLILDRCSRVSDCDEYLVWSAGPDCGCVDLQG